ncbi:MAG: glutaredoxin [Benniella sp.]|nr:MAG: glutaredoxin [Benniella sp.]
MASTLTSSIRSLIRTSITQNPVMIFSKSYCPYCLRVKDLFQDLDLKYTALELDEHDQGTEIQQALKVVSGQSTVPNVFVKGHHVGGCDATIAANETGKLQSLLKGDVWAKLPAALEEREG